MDIKSIYDDVEEVKLVIHSLLTQTEEGKIVWVCDEYEPASLLAGRDNLAQGECIIHMGTFSHQTPMRCFKLEITETIEFNSVEAGLLSPKLSIYDVGNTLLFETETNILNDKEDKADEYGFIPLCNAIFKRSKEWLRPKFFQYMNDLYFFPSIGITRKQKNHPLSLSLIHI